MVPGLSYDRPGSIPPLQLLRGPSSGRKVVEGHGLLILLLDLPDHLLQVAIFSDWTLLNFHLFVNSLFSRQYLLDPLYKGHLFEAIFA